MSGDDGKLSAKDVADLVNAPTGREVNFGAVQITDREAFGRIAEIVVNLQMRHGPDAMSRFMTAWEQDDGSLHVITSSPDMYTTHAHVPRHGWQELSEHDLAMHMAAKEEELLSGDLDDVADRMMSALRQHEKERDLQNRVLEAATGVAWVLERDADSFSMVGKLSQLVPQLSADVDSWVSSAKPYAIFCESKSVRVPKFIAVSSLDELLGPAFARLKDHGVDLAGCGLLLRLQDLQLQNEIVRAWVAAGGESPESLLARARLDEDASAPGRGNELAELAMQALKGSKAIVGVDRESIEKKDLSRVGDILGKWGSSDKLREYFAGAMSISVAGYNDDKRMLCEIPDVCTYFQELLGAYPSWFHFMRRDSAEFNLWIGVLTAAQADPQPDGSVQYLYDPKAVHDLFAQVAGGLSTMMVEFGWGLDDPRSDQTASEVAEFFVSLVRQGVRRH